MTRDDIERMAQEAGIVVTGEAVWKLCELVAAAERESTIKESLTVADPVAWMTRFDDPERSSYGKLATTHLTQDEAERQAQRHIQKKLCKLRIEPSYAAQPRKEWVGLTDEDMQECIKTADYNQEQYKRTFFWSHLATAIEAKLKEKNT